MVCYLKAHTTTIAVSLLKWYNPTDKKYEKQLIVVV